MAGAFHGVGEPEKVINVGVSGPGVVCTALKAVKGQPFDVVAETVKKTAFRVTRMGQLVAQEASLGWTRPSASWISPWRYPGHRRQRGPHSGGDGPGGLRHPRHYGGAGPVERRGEEGRRHGVLLCGRPLRRFIPVSEDEGMIAAARSGASIWISWRP